MSTRVVCTRPDQDQTRPFVSVVMSCFTGLFSYSQLVSSRVNEPLRRLRCLRSPRLAGSSTSPQPAPKRPLRALESLQSMCVVDLLDLGSQLLTSLVAPLSRPFPVGTFVVGHQQCFALLWPNKSLLACTQVTEFPKGRFGSQTRFLVRVDWMSRPPKCLLRCICQHKLANSSSVGRV
jgi:hypothetical protein